MLKGSRFSDIFKQNVHDVIHCNTLLHYEYVQVSEQSIAALYGSQRAWVHAGSQPWTQWALEQTVANTHIHHVSLFFLPSFFVLSFCLLLVCFFHSFLYTILLLGDLSTYQRLCLCFCYALCGMRSYGNQVLDIMVIIVFMFTQFCPCPYVYTANGGQEWEVEGLCGVSKQICMAMAYLWISLILFH